MTANLAAVAHVVQVVGDMPNPEPEPESGQPLPPEKDAKLDHLPNALSAYRICRTLESNATSDQDRIYARILGYLILHAPTPLALAEVIRVIHSCGQDENNLSNLGKCFFNWYIRPFRKFKGRTPVPSDHPSRPSFDKTKLDIKALIKEAPKTHTEAKKQALIRDGYKCVVTGKYDMEAYKGSLVDRRVIRAAGNPVHTELAHILPDSTYFDVSDTCTSSSVKKEYAASVLAVLSCFGYDVEKINGPKVHSLFNVMTMEKNAHDYFDRLELWLEGTEVENRYRVRTTFDSTKEVPDEVTFTSPDPSILPYPSPQLLALHAACAKVAHLSGAGECIDEFDRDTDDLDVLATDGTLSASGHETKISGGPFTLIGTSIGLTIRDSSGLTAQTAAFTINSGSNSSCVGQPLSSGGSAPATSGVSGSTGTHPATTPATTGGATTGATTGAATGTSTGTGSSASSTSITSSASANSAMFGTAGVIGAALVALLV